MPDPVDQSGTIANAAAQNVLQNAEEFGEKITAATATAAANKQQPETGADSATADQPGTPPRQCAIAEGPQYSPSGDISPQPLGREKYAFFSMSARFDNNSAAGHDPSCCEVRQYIKWDNAYQESRGGRPHSGFDEKAGPNVYHEDVEEKGICHYGHRDENCNGAGNNQYFTAGKPDPANGSAFRGWDEPRVARHHQGSFEFEMRVIDTCNQNTVRGVSPHVRVQW